MQLGTLEAPVEWIWQIGVLEFGRQWNSSWQVQSGINPEVQKAPLVHWAPEDDELDEELEEELEDDEPLEEEELLLDDELLELEEEELLLDEASTHIANLSSAVEWLWQIALFELGIQWNSSLSVQSGIKPGQQKVPLVHWGMMQLGTLEAPVEWLWQMGVLEFSKQWNSSWQVQSGINPEVQKAPLVHWAVPEDEELEEELEEILPEDELLDEELEEDDEVILPELLELEEEEDDEDEEELVLNVPQKAWPGKNDVGGWSVHPGPSSGGPSASIDPQIGTLLRPGGHAGKPLEHLI